MEKFLNILSKSWFLIVFIISMVLWYSDTNNKIKIVFAQQAEQQEQIDKIIEILEIFDDVKTDIAVMKKDIEYIKVNVK